MAKSLLDEIASGLTEGECKALVAAIKAIHATGTTIIRIEHVLHALTSVVERLLVLDYGRVIGIGAPADTIASKEVREIYPGARSLMLLKTHSLTANYSQFRALFGVDIAVAAGECVAIIGSNGAGKSTLMRSITGVIRNEARYGAAPGPPIGALSSADVMKRGVAMIPEGRRLFPSLTVEENLLIGGRARKAPGPWNLASVDDLFPILRKRRKSSGVALSGGSSRWSRSAGR